MKHSLIRKTTALALVLLSVQAWADVRLPKIFGSHMVLQRRKPVPVWGWADPGEKVTVQLTGSGQVGQIKSAKADKTGKWMLRLDPLEAGGPYQFVVKGKKNALTLEDVLIGEVWICSGQSNMGMTVKSSANSEAEIKAANFPMIRHFTVSRDMSLTPKDDLKGGDWLVTSPETVGNFSGVGYFFGRELTNKLNVPIGLINTSWGGTQVESWTSREAMNSFEEFKEVVARMPASVDDLAQTRKKQLEDLIQKQQGGLPDAQTVQSWSAASLDDATWKTIEVPDRFDRQAVPNLDGAVWFRKEITLPDNAAGQSATLSLGAVDDVDVTYMNGVKIGEARAKSADGRTYAIPANVLKAGRNVIAVRIEDLGGNGGFIGQPEQVTLKLGTQELPLAGTWKYRVESSVDNKQFLNPNSAGTLLYNSMVAPLIPYAIQGTIWYQGETNAGRAYQYRKSFPLMIRDWHNRWGEKFPFLFVQLASYNAGNGNSERGSTWAELREAQTLALTEIPQTAMAVTTDIGEPKDIHPKNKQDVGKRLAAQALNKVYGQTMVCSGPAYQTMQTEGPKAVLTFQSVGGGLKSSDKYGYLKGFEVAGEDQKFHWAKASIEGDKVIVWCDEVSKPVAVRYGWADDNSEANLYNKEGFPALPFRTDTWKGITELVKFR
ncbi:sialate O-acetylesterase [Tellurirhabdus bombi]|uniref:sialate O-acetylesterase n=1 Tax=Tellurirhabdus bombi TaxID=2907205 RepID=UPI001F301052|nr:sialate O-acetylesterase [Tellurirhabdus bombi]